MQTKNNNNNGYRTHDISRLISSYDGNASNYVEITEEELVKNTINKYPLFRDINNSKNNQKK
jgi:hypothetical protein